MQRYDGGFSGGWGPHRGYEWNRPPRDITGGGRWTPRDVQYGRWEGPGGYDRGIYGGAYEAPQGRYTDEPDPRRGWGGYGGDFRNDNPGDFRGGYSGDFQGGYARRPFIPEQAYQRHPELSRQPGPRGERWGYDLDDSGWEMDDGAILNAVRRRLYEDVWVDIDRIDVEVEDGVVTLRGEVDDFMEARYAWDDAWETQGVRGVLNHLTVRVDQAQAHPHGDVLPQSSAGASSEPNG